MIPQNCKFQSPPLLAFPPMCRQAVLIRRIKRFIVECADETGPFWAHTNNSGSMLGLTRPGSPVLVSPASNPNRKLPYTLELVGLIDRTVPMQQINWVGVNTMTPNRLLQAAFTAQLLPWATGYTQFQPETKRGASRIDALLTGPGLPPLWVECKNVTMVEDDAAAFPDAASTRGQKHLREMTDIVKNGERAAFFYCVQRGDGTCFTPADYVDPAYAQYFYAAAEAGVECHAHRALVSLEGISLGGELSRKKM